MSGGSLDYLYSRVEDAADRIERTHDDPLHKAFAEHLRKVAKALHDVEWVMSGDYALDDDDEAIRAVLSPGVEVDFAMRAAQESVARLQSILQEHEEASR